MRIRSFGRGTGLRVSEISLGGALFGTAWGYGAEPKIARRLIDAYAEAGGNFIDTADFYQSGQSEEIVGEAVAGRRDRFVVATKFTLGAQAEAHPLTTGNSRKNLVRSLEESLRRLRTDRIDLLWVHMPDGLTSSEELMRALDQVVRDGKVLYIGLSDFPAWRVARAATIAELRGWAPLAGLQTQYSLVERASDRELLPMAKAFGLGVTAWSPLGGGLLSGKYRRGEAGRTTTFGAVVHHEDDPVKTAALDAVLAVAEEAGATPSQVALAWLLAHGIIPILGPRTIEQLHDNLGATSLALTPDQTRRLDQASAPSLGFPHDFLAEDMQRIRLAGGDASAPAAAGPAVA